MKPRWPTIEHYVCFDSDFDGWIEAEDGNYRWVEGDERDPCGLCYTSGTTGDPKGVLYEHRSTVLHAMTVIAPDVFNVSGRSVMLPIVPMFHANSWCIPYAAAIAGFKLVMRFMSAGAAVRPVRSGRRHAFRRGADGLARHDRSCRANRCTLSALKWW